LPGEPFDEEGEAAAVAAVAAVRSGAVLLPVGVRLAYASVGFTGGSFDVALAITFDPIAAAHS
jgi:hypothetical protein